VVLAAGSSYWHMFNKEGLYAVNSDQLKLVQYQHCPWHEVRVGERTVRF
jgi:ABC-type microcin C transport system permease subunit YejB